MRLPFLFERSVDMITYSKEASVSYIESIERLQAELGNVPTNIIDYTDLHWLIHTALDDLKKAVAKEWNR